MSYHSQANEDQIIEDLTKKIGISKGWFAEFGANDGYTLSNTARLMEDFGWSGVYVESDLTQAASLKRNMAGNSRIHVIQSMVTAENINDIFASTPLSRDFDFLSINIDGNDYWVWKALTYSPKIVCIEYNSNFHPHESMVLKYDPLRIYHNDKNYGASAFALTQLGRRKGYNLVAYTPMLNLFFVKRDLSKDIPEIDVNSIQKADCHTGVLTGFVGV
jgi:hypothetical protein